MMDATTDAMIAVIAKFLFFVAFSFQLHQLGLYAWRTTDYISNFVEPPSLEMTAFIAVLYLGAIVKRFIKTERR